MGVNVVVVAVFLSILCMKPGAPYKLVPWEDHPEAEYQESPINQLLRTLRSQPESNESHSSESNESDEFHGCKPKPDDENETVPSTTIELDTEPVTTASILIQSGENGTNVTERDDSVPTVAKVEEATSVESEEKVGNETNVYFSTTEKSGTDGADTEKSTTVDLNPLQHVVYNVDVEESTSAEPKVVIVTKSDDTGHSQININASSNQDELILNVEADSHVPRPVIDSNPQPGDFVTNKLDNGTRLVPELAEILPNKISLGNQQHLVPILQSGKHDEPAKVDETNQQPANTSPSLTNLDELNVYIRLDQGRTRTERPIPEGETFPDKRRYETTPSRINDDVQLNESYEGQPKPADGHGTSQTHSVDGKLSTNVE